MHNTTHYRTLTLFAIMLMMSSGAETCTLDEDPTDEKTSPKKKTEKEVISSTNEADTANKNNGNTPPGNDKKATDEEEDAAKKDQEADAAKKDQEAVEKKLMNDLSEKLKKSGYFGGIQCARDLKFILQQKIRIFKDVCEEVEVRLDIDISNAIFCHDDSIHISRGPESEAKQKAIKAAIHDPFEKGELQKARDAAEGYREKQKYRTTRNRFGRIVIYLDFLIKMKQNNLYDEASELP